MPSVITPKRADGADATALIVEFNAHLQPLYPSASRHGSSVQLLAQVSWPAAHCGRLRCRLAKILVAFLLLAIAPASVGAQGVLTPAQAAAKVGQDVTMYMKVLGTGSSTGGFVDLLSEKQYQHADAFLIRVSPKGQELYKEQKIANVARHFRQQIIKVRGKVKTVNFNFGKRPSIEVDAPDQIEITDPEGLYPPGAEITKLYKSGKLFQREAYKQVRTAFAKRFAERHQADIRKAYGEDYDALDAWFAKNVDTKENFYTALLEGHDDIPKALALFKEIWKQYPQSLQKWGQLAIATAVTWDQDQGVYDYKPHQMRVQATLPAGTMDALANYKFIVSNEKKMPQPVYYYPWEFLVFVVNHRTPLAERRWAYTFFVATKGKTRSWHQDVPYDMAIIRREINKDPSAPPPKLAGRPYTLENIRTYGGVCATRRTSRAGPPRASAFPPSIAPAPRPIAATTRGGCSCSSRRHQKRAEVHVGLRRPFRRQGSFLHRRGARSPYGPDHARPRHGTPALAGGHRSAGQTAVQPHHACLSVARGRGRFRGAGKGEVSRPLPQGVEKQRRRSGSNSRAWPGAASCAARTRRSPCATWRA